MIAMPEVVRQKVDSLLSEAYAIWSDFVGPYCYDEEALLQVNELEEEASNILSKYGLTIETYNGVSS